MIRLPFLLLIVATLTLGAAPANAQSLIPGLGGGSSSGESSSDGGSGEGSGQSAPLQQLLEVLKDDQARQQLITELEETVNNQGDGSASGESSSESGAQQSGGGDTVTEELRLAGAQIADRTDRVASDLRTSLSNLWTQMLAVPGLFTSITGADMQYLYRLAISLSALIVITYGGLFLMRAVTDRLRNRLRITINSNGWVSRTLAVLATLTLDLVNMLVPWAAGYAVAFAILGTPGTLSFAQSLYLNAFLAIEAAMAVLRTILAPRRDSARLVSLDGPQAAAIMRWSRIIGLLLAYGQLLVLPLVTRTLSNAAGRAIGILGLILVLAVLAAAIMRARGPVTRLLMRYTNNRGVAAILRYWHIPLLAYLGVLLVIALAQPISALYAVLVTNLQMGAAILTGFVAVHLLGVIISRGVHVPESLATKIPPLERSINAFVPQVLKVVRFIVIAGVVIFCVHVTGILDFMAFIETEFGSRLIWGGLTIAVILLVSFGLWLVLNSWVEFRVNPDYSASASSRERTLLALLRNAVTIGLILIVLMFVLSELGLNIAPLLASAGVIGLAIGFGAQKLVQDIITGIFIQLERAMDVGDVVSIGGISGVVEKLTVRSAGLRDLEGTYHIVPFSSVDIVTNFMRGFSYALVDMGVAYREDVGEAREAMFDAFEELKDDPDVGSSIVDELEWMGLDSFGASEIVLRVRIKTMPGMQWATRRAYNAIIKRIFDERGIEIPYPHQTIYFGEDKAGKAAPMHVVNEEPGKPSSSGSSESKKSTGSGSKRRKSSASKPSNNEGQKMPDQGAGPDGGR